MGVIDFFDAGDADFSGISAGLGKGKPKIIKFYHESVIEVDQTGTTASAASCTIPCTDRVVKNLPKQFFYRWRYRNH